MLFEIVTTYTQSGVLKDTKGFCPVAITEKTPKSFIKPLVDLAKRQVVESDKLRNKTRRFYSHFWLKFEGKRFNLLTRGVRQGDDLRTFVVHQMLFDAQNLKTCGPAAILQEDSHWISSWSPDQTSKILPSRDLETGVLANRICTSWKDVAGDGGWAGAPIEAWERRQSCVLLMTPKYGAEESLKLFVESQSLLPNEHRWNVIISVAAWHPFSMDRRFWMAFDRGTQFEIESIRSNALRIDLSNRLRKASGKFSEAARSGMRVDVLSPEDGKNAIGSGSFISSESQKVSDSVLRFEPKSKGDHETTGQPAGESRDSDRIEERTNNSPSKDSPTSVATQRKTLSAERRKRRIAVEEKLFGANSSENDQPEDEYLELGEPIESSQANSLDQPIASPDPTSAVEKSVDVAEELEPIASSTRSRSGLVFAATAAVILLIVGGLIWYGVNYMTQMANALNNASLRAPDVNRETSDNVDTPNENSQNPIGTAPSNAQVVDPNELSTRQTVSDEQNNSTVDSPEDDESPNGNSSSTEETGPSFDTVATAFSNGAIVNGFSLSTDPAIESQTMATMPLELENPGSFFDLSLNTFSSFSELDWDDDEQGWLVPVRQNGDSQIAAVVSLIAQDESDGSMIAWRWLETDEPLPKDRLDEIQSGLLQIAVRNSKTQIQVPLTAPVEGSAVRLMDTLMGQAELVPHLPNYLCNQSIFEKFDWQITGVTTGQTGEATKRVLAKPRIDPQVPNRVLFDVQQEAMKAQLEELLEVDFLGANEFNGRLQPAFDFHGPLGLQIDFSFATNASAAIEVLSQVKVMIDSPRQDNSPVILKREKTDSRSKQREFEKEVKTKIVYGLMMHLGVSGEKCKRIITSGGIGCRSANTTERKLKSAIGGVLYKSVLEALENSLQLEVTRTYRFGGRNSKKSMSIKAIQLATDPNRSVDTQ